MTVKATHCVITQNGWGLGDTLEDALKEVRKAGHATALTEVGYVSYVAEFAISWRVHPLSGNVSWSWEEGEADPNVVESVNLK